LAQMGGEEAFEKVVLFYEKPVYHYLLRFSKNQFDAEDITQEVFLKTYKYLKKYDFRYKFSTWLFAIATNCAKDHFRKKSRRKEDFVIDDPKKPFENFYASQCQYWRGFSTHLKIDLESAFLKIRPVYKNILKLFYFEGYGYREIAELTNLPINTVKTYLYRAKISLAKELK